MNPLLKNKRGKTGMSRIMPLMRRHNERCYYCERKVYIDKLPYATVEHVVPLGEGGKNTKDNRVLACHSCNFMKSNMPLDMFLEELESLSIAVVERKKRMEDEEKEAYLYGAEMAGEYIREIGKSDLAELTPNEVLTFSECMCKNYHLKLVELQNNKKS